jgi:hypothetical protein
MKTKLLSIFIITCLSLPMFLATASSVSAQTILPGVSKGEIFDYSYYLLWNSTDPSAIPPREYIELNNTQQIQLKITAVSGSNINVDYVKLFKNGTRTVESGSINIESGTVTIPAGFLIISANLSKNQRVYPSGGYQVISDTVIRSYPSGQRETNIVSGEDPSDKTVIYFDKIKGVAVSYQHDIIETSDVYTTITTVNMINTNSDVWTVIPEFPVFVIPLLLIFAASLMIVAIKKQKISSVFSF